MNSKRTILLLWILLALFAVVNLSSSLVPGVFGIFSLLVVTFVPFLFALIHGSLRYGWRSMLVFVVITLVVSNILENLSILTGFPFGHYYYTDALGPKLFLVPILIGVAYFGVGYLSWTLARIILGNTARAVSGLSLVTIPIIAAFIMVSWDLSFDPTLSTIGHDWIWQQGGGYFGVPFSNFLGWYLTVYIFYQLFALYLSRRDDPGAAVPAPKSYWLQAVLFYGTSGLGLLLGILPNQTTQTIADATGAVWSVQAIHVTTGLAALFTMLAYTVLSLIKIAEMPSEPTH